MPYSTPQKYSKFMLYLAIFYFTFMVASYVVAYKMVKIGPVLETGAIFLFPLSYSIADIIAELYGYTFSRQLIWASTLGGLVFCLAVESIIALHSPAFWHHQAAYNLVLGHVLKIYLAMTAANVIGSLINVRLIIKWKILLRGKYFWLRSIGSSALGELFFSVIAGTISFAGIEPLHKIYFLMLDGYLSKLSYALIAAIPCNIVVHYIKQRESQVRAISIDPFNDKELETHAK